MSINKLKKIFKNRKPIVVGMVHCAPLMGYDDSPGIKEVEKKFTQDLKALVAGGVDGIMIENNYDVPHYEKAKSSTIPQLTKLCLEARKLTKKPLGICVLWNDYEAALSIAKMANFQFVRVPVFVDKVETDYGIFNAKADDCIKFRKQINAENILIFADVQVKHAKHLIKRSLNNAIAEAIKKQADGIIVTGKWTGDPPTIKDVKEAKKETKNVPLILGSGIIPENIKNYDVDGFIVGSYFKGDGNPKERDYHNIFKWNVKMKKNRIEKFMENMH